MRHIIILALVAPLLAGCYTTEQLAEKEAKFRATMSAVRAGAKIAREELAATINELCSIVPSVEMKAAEVRAAITVTPGTRVAAAVAAAGTSVTIFVEACTTAQAAVSATDVQTAIVAARRIGDSYNRAKTAINNANAAVKAIP